MKTTMKATIDHLPYYKQSELARVAQLIRANCDDVELIALYGSYARGNWREEEDLAPDRKSGDISDYDIWVVCGRKDTATDYSLWNRISEACRHLPISAIVQIVSHDIKFVKKRLHEIHYFFADIIKEGCVLYTSGKYELYVARELPPELKYRVASEHFEEWFDRAQGFHRAFGLIFEQGDLDKEAVFNLHQSAESAYKAFLLVFTNYCPRGHYLLHLDRQAQEIVRAMAEAFPCPTEVEKERFKHFDYAYIGARYDRNFFISKEDLVYFSRRVKVLLELTERFCKEKLQSYARDQNRTEGAEG